MEGKNKFDFRKFVHLELHIPNSYHLFVATCLRQLCQIAASTKRPAIEGTEQPLWRVPVAGWRLGPQKPSPWSPEKRNLCGKGVQNIYTP